MHIQIDGRSYVGTPLQIVDAMRERRFTMAPAGGVGDYIAFAQANVRRWFGVDLPVAGASDAERAASFVAQMLARGLAVQGPPFPVGAVG